MKLRVAAAFVTLQGELVDSDGTLYAGTVRGESAVLSRKSELADFETNCIEWSTRLHSENCVCGISEVRFSPQTTN